MAFMMLKTGRDYGMHTVEAAGDGKTGLLMVIDQNVDIVAGTSRCDETTTVEDEQ